jgi:hypothetical protein
MSETHAPSEHQPGLYEIRIKGHLDDQWSDWFGGLYLLNNLRCQLPRKAISAPYLSDCICEHTISGDCQISAPTLHRDLLSRYGGLTITLEEDGDTLLTGPVVDQAALHGLLRIVRDLGMPLVSVSPLEQGPS